jgi:thiosulfate/3-mercaptopyruvate sulfurtransferase
MKSPRFLTPLGSNPLLVADRPALADIGIISPAAANKRPTVLDTRRGCKDCFRGDRPTAHHINFDTLRGTGHAVPVQYPPDDLTKALLTPCAIRFHWARLPARTGGEPAGK